MNSLEISSILSNNRWTKNCFMGVFSSNNIKTFVNYPYGIVVNTDKVGEPGTHWVAIYVLNDNHAEYFDSYGQEPNLDIEKYLKKFTKLVKNKIKIQSYFDISCGPHVIYYLVQRCRGKSLRYIINDLISPYSDALVKLFVYELLHSQIV